MENKYKEISVDLIDAPVDQQRIDIDEEKLDELRESIRDHGLINPIAVRAVGARYELIAGSRRLRCHRILEMPIIKTVVLDVDEKEADLLRAHENEFRHDPNPIESGLYIARLQYKHNMSIQDIAKQMNKSETYVRSRIELMTYPEYILEPIQSGKLSVGAAHHLNKIIPDDKRRQYVAWAVWRGITGAQAASWLSHSELGGHVQRPEQLPEPEAKTPEEKYRMQAECIICRNVDDVSSLGFYYAHTECEKAITGKGVEGVA